MINLRKILGFVVIVSACFGDANGLNKQINRRSSSQECRRAFIVAKTTEKMCLRNLNGVSDYTNSKLTELCSTSSGCLMKMSEAYNNFQNSCSENDISYKKMLLQHSKDLTTLICKKDGSSYCLEKMNSMIESKPKSADDISLCEGSCVSDSYDILSKGVVSITAKLRNDIIRSRLLCSKVPGKDKYCINKLKSFREEGSYERKMNIFCDSLCVQKTLWKDQDEYSNYYSIDDSPESIVANFTDSACQYYNNNRCGTLLLKVLNNDFGCSGLRNPRIFPFSGNYTLCSYEVNNVIKEYGTCVKSLFGNKGGDWSNLYIELARYSKTRRLVNFKILEKENPAVESFNRTYEIGNFDWEWYQSNDRAVSSYIISSIAAHLGIPPSMISGQGFNNYAISINGLTEKQHKELDDEHTMGLPMFSNKISVSAMKDQTKGFSIDYGTMVLPNMLTILAFSSILLYIFIRNN